MKKFMTAAAAVIGLVASLIGIFTFFTNYQHASELFSSPSASQPTAEPASSNAAYRVEFSANPLSVKCTADTCQGDWIQMSVDGGSTLRFAASETASLDLSAGSHEWEAVWIESWANPVVQKTEDEIANGRGSFVVNAHSRFVFEAAATKDWFGTPIGKKLELKKVNIP